MFRVFSSLLGNSPRKPRPTVRKARLGLEALDGRIIPSVTPLLAATGPGGAIYHVPPVVPPVVTPAVPNFTGYTFHLISTNGKPAHDLLIQSETFNADGSASFAGLWHGENPDGSGQYQAVTGGRLVENANGTTTITFSWNDGANYFSGTITPVPNKYSNVEAMPPVYTITGMVTAANGGGPGAVTGTGAHTPVNAD